MNEIENQLYYWETLLLNLNLWVNKKQWYNKKNIIQIIKELKWKQYS